MLIKSIRSKSTYKVIGAANTDVIRAEWKDMMIGINMGQAMQLLVYRGYDKDGQLLWELESNQGLDIVYSKIGKV